MKYHLKKQSDLVLNKNHQYNILGFDSTVPSHPNVSGISEPGFCKRYVYVLFFCFCFVSFFVTTSILVKVTKIIWWSVKIQMDFNRNSA